MSAASPTILGIARHPDEARVGRRATVSLVVLLLVALAAVGAITARSIRQQEESRVVAHLGVALQAALSEASREASIAQQRAASLAADPRLQHALAAGDEHAVERLTASIPGAAAVAGTQAVPTTARASIRREAHILSRGKVVGTVAVTLPLDGAALAKLRAVAPLRAGEGLLFLRGDRALAAPAQVVDARVPARATSARIGGFDYRVVQTRLLGGAVPIRLAVFAPAAEIEAPVRHSERLLLASLAVTFFALLLLARLLAGPALVPLMRLARDARTSRTDDLTKLANRRAFAEATAAELVRARRSHRPLAVALFDIDDFKRVNDTLGHPAGDKVLCKVADVLRAHFREIDVPARLGGEEFAVLMPETDITGARDAAERFVTALAASEFDDASGALSRGITVSAGVAAAADREIPALLDAADRALYRAKAGGKNQVQVEEL